jgi:molybdopterin/thiamine biosynthesis adenylyltransferase
LFEERFLLNQACVRQGKPLIDCAMYGLEGQVIPIVPGETPCLACIYPETPEHWKRRFPVIGAVSALVANIGALEGMKYLAGFGPVSTGSMLWIDTTTMAIRKITVERRPECPICGGVPATPSSPRSHHA